MDILRAVAQLETSITEQTNSIFLILKVTAIENRQGKHFFKNQYLINNVMIPLVIEKRVFDRTDKNSNSNLGMEHFLSDKTSITGTVFYPH
ncbi:hypothetical protein [Gelidibacter sp. F63206]|uniref:hypothetical protein n=1 Tax=Gelidibacter sp. F63206 TaxID=2926425 RepID=UPI001FF3745A|nr:hypothetical protein [Gelidibacter sp. F63206]MCK0114964.1 hypothetical protein [Gelidibacter sp. F63206]